MSEWKEREWKEWTERKHEPNKREKRKEKRMGSVMNLMWTEDKEEKRMRALFTLNTTHFVLLPFPLVPFSNCKNRMIAV